MNRREFSMLVGGAAAGWAQRASAQQAAQQQKAAPGNPAPRLDWLARHKEPVLEPGLPIIDPHHHLWQRPGWRYLLDELLTDTGSGHNIVATVYMEASAMYRDQGPEEMRPVGEVEFANGVAAMCGSGVFGKTRVAAGIVGHADMMLGSRVEPVLNAKGLPIRRDSLLVELKQRIREVRQGPDGLLYLLTDEDAGALLRIEPVRAATAAGR